MNDSFDQPSRLEALSDAYEAAFGVRAPIYVVGPSDDFIAATVEAAISAGKPIPADFDWYAYLPPGAVA